MVISFYYDYTMVNILFDLRKDLKSWALDYLIKQYRLLP